MNYNKCKGCQWYGKPYWSVISPCDSCPREERYGEELYKDYLEKQVKDYKSRIEKAVEYIKEQPKRELSVDSYFKFEDLVEFDELLDILNGRSDE